eukprot:1194898-Prorocentrum_minimum.AAC.2
MSIRFCTVNTPGPARETSPTKRKIERPCGVASRGMQERIRRRDDSRERSSIVLAAYPRTSSRLVVIFCRCPSSFCTPKYANKGHGFFDVCTCVTRNWSWQLIVEPQQVFNGVSTSRPTMNITTYATPIAIQPARRFIIALYHGTLSADNMLAKGRGVLQILGEQHAELLPLLGKSSGHEKDKVQPDTRIYEKASFIAELQERGFDVVERFGVPTLADCLGVVGTLVNMTSILLPVVRSIFRPYAT